MAIAPACCMLFAHVGWRCGISLLGESLGGILQLQVQKNRERGIK
jgi:hypothetical protein